MKKIFFYSLILLATGILWGCKKDGNYPGGTVSPYISIFDIRDMHKGNDVTLTKENMFGANKMAVVVVSDHSAGNMPEGLVAVQDARRLGRLRGIAISLGADAASYAPGDSLVINIEGKTLKRENGILVITGLTSGDINKLASVTVNPTIVKSNLVLNKPDEYESTLVSITSAGFDAATPPGSIFAGDRIINDGFGNMVLHTEATADFANDPLPYLSNFTGVVFRNADGEPLLWPRTGNDITVLSANPPKIASFIITGYLTDPTGTDANHEYIQFMATRDIDFSVTPFSVVTTNNAGTAQPTGAPVNGWATGGARTYKMDLTSGTVVKGEYFYVGANKKIWGSNSTDISSSKWFGKMYADVDGDGFGTKTTNLLANSGNAAGIAVFEGTTVAEETVPDDVIFYGGNGVLFSAGPPTVGYRITNTDYYDVVNPVTLEDQPFYTMGSNTGKFAFPTTSNFTQLGGTYNISTGRWTSARIQNNVALTATSTVVEIEGATMIEQ
jgi:hypothetical protein